jgi:hypothetical protein
VIVGLKEDLRRIKENRKVMEREESSIREEVERIKCEYGRKKEYY